MLRIMQIILEGDKPGEVIHSDYNDSDDGEAGAIIDVEDNSVLAGRRDEQDQKERED